MAGPAGKLRGSFKRIEIDRVVPYWRNPRRLSEEAVEAVRESIERYGYSQPIVVDQEYVIIIGHTRYAALRRLNVPEVDVLVTDHLSPAEAKELRVIDNRAGEYAFWDFDKLQDEIANSENQLLAELFPEILGLLEDEPGSSVTIDWSSSDSDEEVDTLVEFVCPKCFHEWEADVTREQIMSGETLAVRKENERDHVA